jgi:hypothetical protein
LLFSHQRWEFLHWISLYFLSVIRFLPHALTS